MLMTLLSFQTRLKVCNSNWSNSMTIHVSKGSNWTMTKQKSWSSSAGLLLQHPTFTYDATPLELVTKFKYLGITLTRDGSMNTAAEKMADNFRSAIARVNRTGDSKGIKHRKNVILWLFQVFALTAGLYGCQVRAISSLTYKHIIPVKPPPHMSFILASWKDSWVSRKVLPNTHCMLPETGQMPIFSIGSDASYDSETVTLFKQSSSWESWVESWSRWVWDSWFICVGRCSLLSISEVECWCFFRVRCCPCSFY